MANEYIITQEDLNQGNSYLQTLTTEHPVCKIADGVTVIMERSFRMCTGLTSITIPSSVTVIGPGVFAGCTGLTEITIPSNVYNIGSGAFAGCTGLTSITILGRLNRIWSQTFYSCSNLRSITIPEGPTSIGEQAFWGCSSLVNITIPESVTEIVIGAFSGCSSLVNITIPESVTGIGRNAFENCSSLTSIIIPDGVTVIGPKVFGNCTDLTEITIPSSVTSIDDTAFQNCPNISTIWVRPDFDLSLIEGKVPSSAVIKRSTANGYYPDDERLLVKGNERITRQLYVQGDIIQDTGKQAVIPNLKAGAINVSGETSLKNTTVTGKLTNEGDTEIKGDLDVSGEIIARKDVSISGDLFVNGTQHINDSETSQTSDDYMVLRHNKTTSLGANEHSGIAVHNYMPNKTATLTTDNQGIWRVADNSETSTVYTNVSCFNSDYFSGITQATSVTVNDGIKTAFDEDEYDEVCWYATNDKYYHFDGIHFFELGLVDNALTIGAQITDASLITALEALTRYDLIYFRSLTVTGISEVQNQPLLTRAEESALDNGDILAWDATTKKAVNLTRPVLNNTYLKALIDSQTGVVTYTWASGGGNGVAFIGTRAQYNAARLIPQGQDGFIPAHSKVIITDEDAYVTGEER